jgi:hypothetical protein
MFEMDSKPNIMVNDQNKWLYIWSSVIKARIKKQVIKIGVMTFFAPRISIFLI